MLQVYRQLPLVAALAVAGCQMGGSPPPNAYPATPPTVASTPAAAAVTVPAAPTGSGPSSTAGMPAVTLKVPADAMELSSGPYPPPGFNIPNQPGTIEVVDLDGDITTPVASTSVTGTETNKTMSITDVPNMAGHLDKTHRYKIVFVPVKSATSP